LKPPIPLPNNHETRVFQLGGELLSTLEKCRLPRNDETVKGIAWFLICVGESLEQGALQKAKSIYASRIEGSIITPSLAVAFCLKGCEINDWAAGLAQQYHRDKPSVPSDGS